MGILLGPATKETKPRFAEQSETALVFSALERRCRAVTDQGLVLTGCVCPAPPLIFRAESYLIQRLMDNIMRHLKPYATLC